MGYSTPAAAQEIPATTTIERADAVRLGAERGPDVAVAVAPREGTLEARAVAGRLPHPPLVSITGGYRSSSFLPGPEIGVTLTQDFPLRSLSGERKLTSDATAAAIDADVHRARLDGAARAVNAWLTTLEAKELVRLRTDAGQQAEGVLRVAEVRVKSGVALPQELMVARGDAAAAEAGILDAEGMLVESLAELRFVLGQDPTAVLDVTGDLYATDDRAVDETAAIRAAQSHPVILLAQARASVAHHEASLVNAMLGPTITVGGAYLHEGTGDQVWTAIVGIPLPFVNPAAYETARQRAIAMTAEAQIERVQAEMMRDIHLAIHDHEHWREVRDALRDQAVPPMKEALRLARVSYEAGTQDLSLVLLARQRLVGVEEMLARAAGEVQRADLRLQRATGALLAPSRMP